MPWVFYSHLTSEALGHLCSCKGVGHFSFSEHFKYLHPLCILLKQCMAVRRLSGSCWRGRLTCNLLGAQFLKQPGWFILRCISCVCRPSRRCGYTPDSTDSCGVTPFMDAVRTGHIPVARMLVEKHQVEMRLFRATKLLQMRIFFLNWFLLHRRLPQQLLTPSGRNLCTRWPSLARKRHCGIWYWIWK